MSSPYKAAQSNNEIFFKRNTGIHLSYSHDKSGDSVLHIAARYGHLNLIRLFVENDGNPEMCNFDSKRPLHEAAQASQLTVLKYLLENGVEIDCLKRADWTPLMLACTKTDVRIIRELLDKGADPALMNKDGWNSFHIAAREGSVEIAELLLKNNSDLWDTHSKNNRSPLHTAALHGHTELVRYMLKSFDYITDDADTCGSTPLMDALRAGFVETAHVLVKEHKCDIKSEDKLGRQCIHIVSESGQMESLKYILDNFPVSVNTQASVSRGTPLHVAAKEGQTMVMEELISRGADVNMVDSLERTALHIASGAQHEGCVELLFQHGATDSQDRNGKTARDMARKDGVLKVFEKYSVRNET